MFMLLSYALTLAFVSYVLVQARKPNRSFGRVFAGAMNQGHRSMTVWGHVFRRHPGQLLRPVVCFLILYLPTDGRYLPYDYTILPKNHTPAFERQQIAKRSQEVFIY